MELRHFEPTHPPWSPVGYRVVQVADEQASAAQARPQRVEPAPPPSGPLGYRVSQVAEENVPAKPRAPSPRARGADWPPRVEGHGLLAVLDALSPRTPERPIRRRPDPLPLGAVIAAGVGIVGAVLFTVVLVAAHSRDAAPPRPEVVFVDPPVHQHNRPEPVVVIPPEIAAAKAPAAEPADNLAKGHPPAANGLGLKGGDGCEPNLGQAPPGGRETFGTAVAFARNPLEALRGAGREDKLAFVLHVSGNFEEARFTWNNAEALRVSALAHPGVGQYLNRHFVSAFQKVATFEVNGAQKQGGNVAAYFCTPEGRVLHALAGPVNAATFLREARWANDTYQVARLENPTADKLQAFFRKAHLERLREQHVHVPENQFPRPDAVSPKLLHRLLAQNAHLGLNNQGKVHLLLTVSPTPRLGQVYRVVFEGILNEKISTNPVAVAGQ